MNQVEYAPLKYYNNIVSEECIYIGMLFNNLTTGERNFRYISNFSRFQSFDDEADVGFVKAYLAGIKQQVEVNLFNYDKFFSIADYSKIFVNEFRFSSPTTINTEDKEDYIQNLTKLYLKFDFNKKQRLSNNEEKHFIKRILLSSNATMLEPRVPGIYNEKVKFDYLIGDIAIKVFTLKDKDPQKLIPAAKQWSFSAEELKDQYKVFFLYDDDTVNSSNAEIVLRILRQHANAYQIQYGLEQVVKAIS